MSQGIELDRAKLSRHDIYMKLVHVASLKIFQKTILGFMTSHANSGHSFQVDCHELLSNLRSMYFHPILWDYGKIFTNYINLYSMCI